HTRAPNNGSRTAMTILIQVAASTCQPPYASAASAHSSSRNRRPRLNAATRTPKKEECRPRTATGTHHRRSSSAGVGLQPGGPGGVAQLQHGDLLDLADPLAAEAELAA